MVAWYSHATSSATTSGRRSRYSIHFMFANDNIVEHNQFYDNAVGIYFMYTEGGARPQQHHFPRHRALPAWVSASRKPLDTIIENNEIIYCGIGIGSDLSPFQPDSTIEIQEQPLRLQRHRHPVQLRNRRQQYSRQRLRGQPDPGYLRWPYDNANATKNYWEGNYWDDYQGFDRNGDGIGDQIHENYAYADQIWMEMPVARFFRSSPVMELLDFLERLAPFSTPDLSSA